MIRVYKVLEDQLKPLDSLEDYNPATEIGWIDLVEPTVEEDHAVEDFLKLSIPTKEDMQEIELSAQLYDEAGARYMTMLAIAQQTIDDPVKTPVTFIIHGGTLVTVRYFELTSFSQYLAAARRKGGVAVPSADGLMVDILESVVGRVADSLEKLGVEMDSISREIFRVREKTVKSKSEKLQSAITRVGAKGDLLGMLRESLATISRVSSHVVLQVGDTPNKALRSKISILNRDVASLNDHAAFMAGKMNFLLEATLGMINLDQNQVIKIFSIVAVVFLPPTLVATVYGMNFTRMPELDWQFGYPLAIGAMVIAALVPLWYFNRKGWL